MRRISALLESSVRTREGIVASALPVPLAGGAIGGWRGLMNGLFGLNGRLRVYLEEYRGQLRSTAFVYDGRRPEWVVLMLAALPEPGGTDSAFRLLSGISASAARSGMQRLFAAVPDEARPRETFFQAGFYSYTRETWYAATGAALAAPSQRMHAREATAVNARDLVRAAVRVLPAGRAITSPVRSYEEHVARALLSEGFRDAATSMLFVKELAVRVEEPALAPAVVR